MPLRTTALKRWKVAERNRKRNLAVNTELKSRIKRFRQALDEGASETEDLLNVALRKLDKAATKGIIHKRNAARRKSRLQQLYNKASASAGEAAEA